MQYPFWDFPAGYGILMAVVSVIHVFISHFAIGGGLFLVVNERAARKTGNEALLSFVRGLTRFFVLVTLVGGALTGVGIWFVIGLLSPAGTEVLIHNFVWGWAIEWTFFLVEILAAIFYLYGWDRMPAAGHIMIGWIYFIAAWLSLFIINGILTFMLTPGSWLATGNFWDGFFNPTFWPALVFRSCTSVMLAGLYALTVASRFKDVAAKPGLVRRSALWGLCGLLTAMASLYWYWNFIPEAIRTAAAQSMPTPMLSLNYLYWMAGVLAVLLLVFGLAVPKSQHIAVSVLTMAVGLAWFGAFEWFRESVRKPYIIYGYMYGNGIELSREQSYREGGYLSRIAYRSGNDGADLFRHVCGSCHTIRGYKPLKPALEGTDRAFITSIVGSSHLLRGNMPRFLGTAAEAEAISGYLEAGLERRTLSELYGLTGIDLGKKVFDIRCGICHAMGGPSDKTQSLAGLKQEEYQNILDSAAFMGEGMPAFTAGAAEGGALIEYLKTLRSGGVR